MATLLARRFATARAAATRPFTTSSFSQYSSKAPSLADVGINNAEVFDERQRKFREELAAKQESQSSSNSSAFFDNQSHPGSLSDATRKVAEGATQAATNVMEEASPKKALGSLSSANVGDRQFDRQARKQAAEQHSSQAQDSESSGKKTRLGSLSSIIYGTEEGRQLDRDIERSFSQVLARGKYVHSITFHTVKPDKVDEYMDLVGEWYPKIAADQTNEVHLVGSWRTEIGDNDTFVHIWEYKKYAGFHNSLAHIKHQSEYSKKEHQLKQYLTSKSTSLMQEFSFWPTVPPRKLGGIFELRSYTLHPGNLLEWESHWRKGLQARREVMEGVGAWFVQIGELNTVHHLWQFPDLEERRRRRELCWAVEGWSDTVHKTVPLIQTMKSRVLVPCEWSPVA